MVLDQLNLIQNQTKAALRRQVSGTAANIRRETSLVQQAGRLTGRVTRGLEQAERTVVQSSKTGRHRVDTQTVAQEPRPVKPAPDGYVRQSAVQPIRVPEDYHRQIVRRVVGGVVAAACVLAVVWLLLRSNLLIH